jgi:hypothetical protein
VVTVNQIMGFRFRKRIRIAPGIRINLNKRIPSLSVGGDGLTMNVGKRGTKATVGLPGTGINAQTGKCSWKRILNFFGV